MEETHGRLLACVGRGDPTRAQLGRGLVSELARAEWALHALPKPEEQSLHDEVWRCPVEKSGCEPERSNNVRQQNFIAIFLRRHHAIDNT